MHKNVFYSMHLIRNRSALGEAEQWRYKIAFGNLITSKGILIYEHDYKYVDVCI